MVQMTIREALDVTHHQDTADCYLYLYRDGETVFYVGRSYDPLERLLQHVGRTGRSLPDQIGHLIKDNLPASLDWTIDLYTLAECLPLVEQHNAASIPYYRNNLEHPNRYERLADIAERAMIAQHRPCLNGINARYYSNPLPARYIKQQIANEGVNLGQQ